MKKLVNPPKVPPSVSLPIPGYSRYTVSTDSPPKVVNTRTGRVLTPYLTGIPQYLYVSLVNDEGMPKKVRLHRILAQTHIPNPDNYPMVDHVDGNPMNNDVDNLRWVTRRGNGRNSKVNVYLTVGGIRTLLKKAVEDHYPLEEVYSVYGLFMVRYHLGMRTFEEIVEHIGASQMKSDELTSLKGQLSLYGTTLTAYRNALKRGSPEWNALRGVPFSYPHSVEAEANGVHYWYPLQVLAYRHSRELNPNYNKKIIVVEGVDGTIDEMCVRYGISRSVYKTELSRGRTLDDIFTTGKRKITKYSINGIIKTRKAWCEYYGVSATGVGAWMPKGKKTFKEALNFYGVDTSVLTVLPA